MGRSVVDLIVGEGGTNRFDRVLVDAESSAGCDAACASSSHAASQSATKKHVELCLLLPFDCFLYLSNVRAFSVPLIF